MRNPFSFEVEPFEAYSESDEEIESFDTETTDFEWEDHEDEYWAQEAPPVEVSRNSKDYIRWVQRSLNQIMGLRLSEDGIMGPQTSSAIRSFQQKEGLKVDGIVGPKTEAAIKAALGGTVTPTTSACPPAGQTIQRTVYGWSQYKRKVQELPPDQQAALKNTGDLIKRSFEPDCTPMRTVEVQGHADHDTPRNPQREQQMSEERAQQVTNWLKAYVGSSIAAQITWDTRGFGATQLKAPPTTEANRRQNRRVEILLIGDQNSLRCVPLCQFPIEQCAEFIKWLQASLNTTLRIRLPVTGVFTAADRKALQIFQGKAGLPVTGTIDMKTQQAVRKYGALPPPCNVSVQPKLSFHQIKLKSPDDTKLFRACADFHAKRICAIGDPADFSGITPKCRFLISSIGTGPTPYRNGREIVESIKCAFMALNDTPINEIHIFSHSGPYGVYGSDYPRNDPHSGLYVDYAKLTDKEINQRGARTVRDLPFEALADDVKFFLHGCKAAKKCTKYDPHSFGDECEEMVKQGDRDAWGIGVSFAESLINILLQRSKKKARVFAHPGGDPKNAGVIGVNADWIEFYIDNGNVRSKTHRGAIHGLYQSHFCTKQSKVCCP